MHCDCVECAIRFIHTQWLIPSMDIKHFCVFTASTHNRRAHVSAILQVRHFGADLFVQLHRLLDILHKSDLLDLFALLHVQDTNRVIRTQCEYLIVQWRPYRFGDAEVGHPSIVAHNDGPLWKIFCVWLLSDVQTGRRWIVIQMHRCVMLHKLWRCRQKHLIASSPLHRGHTHRRRRMKCVHFFASGHLPQSHCCITRAGDQIFRDIVHVKIKNGSAMSFIRTETFASL
mmetsp:Transcript_29694/g.48345  ORF Transcript_29694/g.48345 Transcript_29694/m.48345 type:complete len:229 (+) Transcript_29694:404-1090(+)